MFITFEGPEGSGKSTLLQSVDRALRETGRSTLLAHEPGGTPFGDAIRKVFLDATLRCDPLAEAFLLNASRAQLVRDVIGPALTSGRTVLCDRYVDSTLAYQGFGHGLPLEMLWSLCETATGGLFPDVTFLVDVSYETSRARLRQRGTSEDRIEQQDAAFHERVREGFLQLASGDPRIVVIDGERRPEEMLNAAWASLSELVG